MTDHVQFVRGLPADTKQDLLERSDAAGLVHLATYIAALFVTSALILTQVPFWPLLMIPQGILLVFLFTLSHEATHQTPFASRRLNDWVGHAIAPIILLPFIWFRYFHLAHHKYTNDPDRDPEIADHPRPNSWKSYAIYLSGWGYWSGMSRVLVANALGQFDAPYLPERQHSAMQLEARIVLIILTLAFVSLFWSPVLFWLWILPVLIGQPVLRVYLLAEHGLCPPVANMFENTRTTFTSRVVRWLAWNMPYHIEHHSMPNVPFHKLPELHDLMRPHLVSTSHGYSEFTRDYIKTLDA